MINDCSMQNILCSHLIRAHWFLSFQSQIVNSFDKISRRAWDSWTMAVWLTFGHGKCGEPVGLVFDEPAKVCVYSRHKQVVFAKTLPLQPNLQQATSQRLHYMPLLALEPLTSYENSRKSVAFSTEWNDSKSAQLIKLVAVWVAIENNVFLFWPQLYLLDKKG